jgi:hypothetical protein
MLVVILKLQMLIKYIANAMPLSSMAEAASCGLNLID